MTAKPVQISLDTEMLERIDTDQETREKGRSAFIRSAVEMYLRAKERREIERSITAAYEGQSEVMLDEISDFLDAQAWPDR